MTGAVGIAAVLGVWALGWFINTRIARARGRGLGLIAAIIFGVTLLVMWELAVIALEVSRVLLPPPSAIAARFASSTDILWADFLQTFKGVVAGYVLGCGAAFLTAIAIDRSDFLKAGLLPIGNLVAALPIVGIAPIMVMWPGTRQAETEVLEWRGIKSGALYDFYANTMLLSNPPRHAMRRAPVARAFAYKLVEAWRPRVRAILHELIDTMKGQGEADFLTSIASPLPSRLIAEIIGAPSEDAPEFANLVYAMSRGLGAFRDEEFPAINEAAQKLNVYVDDLMEGRRSVHNAGFLSDYRTRVVDAGQLNHAETLMQIVGLVLAGSDTTRFAMTAMIYLLMRHPDQWEELRNEPALVPGAVREALRFEPSVGSIGRFVVDPVVVDGVELRKGTLLQISLLSAQRDETVYRDPQSFDIHRNDHPRWSLTFGFGPHRCLGEALARAELEEVLDVIIERLPGLKLAGPPPQFKGHIGIRGVTPMHISW